MSLSREPPPLAAPVCGREGCPLPPPPLSLSR